MHHLTGRGTTVEDRSQHGGACPCLERLDPGREGARRAARQRNANSVIELRSPTALNEPIALCGHCAHRQRALLEERAPEQDGWLRSGGKKGAQPGQPNAMAEDVRAFPVLGAVRGRREVETVRGRASREGLGG